MESTISYVILFECESDDLLGLAKTILLLLFNTQVEFNYK